MLNVLFSTSVWKFFDSIIYVLNIFKYLIKQKLILVKMYNIFSE